MIIKTEIRRRCKCGCGRIANPGNKYIWGHNRKKIVVSDKTKKKMAVSQIGNISGRGNGGRKFSKDHKKKISLALTGRILSEDHKKKISLSEMGKKLSKETREKQSIAKRNMSQETKLKMSISQTGKKHSKETRNKMSLARKGMTFSKGHKNKMSLAQLENWKDPSFQKKQYEARFIRPNKPETILLNLLNKLFPNEYKYTGDFSFMINGKNPDFVNINGQKKIIELFGDYWHRNSNPQNRINVFTPFGFDVLIIWEHELKSNLKLRRKLKDFHRS